MFERSSPFFYFKKKIITLCCESSYFTIIYDPCGLGL